MIQSSELFNSLSRTFPVRDIHASDSRFRKLFLQLLDKLCLFLEDVDFSSIVVQSLDDGSSNSFFLISNFLKENSFGNLNFLTSSTSRDQNLLPSERVMQSHLFLVAFFSSSSCLSRKNRENVLKAKKAGIPWFKDLRSSSFHYIFTLNMTQQFAILMVIMLCVQCSAFKVWASDLLSKSKHSRISSIQSSLYLVTQSPARNSLVQTQGWTNDPILHQWIGIPGNCLSPVFAEMRCFIVSCKGVIFVVLLVTPTFCFTLSTTHLLVFTHFAAIICYSSLQITITGFRTVCKMSEKPVRSKIADCGRGQDKVDY